MNRILLFFEMNKKIGSHKSKTIKITNSESYFFFDKYIRYFIFHEHIMFLFQIQNYRKNIRDKALIIHSKFSYNISNNISHGISLSIDTENDCFHIAFPL